MRNKSTICRKLHICAYNIKHILKKGTIFLKTFRDVEAPSPTANLNIYSNCFN